MLMVQYPRCYDDDTLASRSAEDDRSRGSYYEYYGGGEFDSRLLRRASVMVHGALAPLAGARSVPPLGSLDKRSRGGRDFVVRAEIVE